MIYLPVYPCEDIFDFTRHSDRVGSIVKCHDPHGMRFPDTAQIRFHMQFGTIICRYVDMQKNKFFDEVAGFVAREIWVASGLNNINGVIVWKLLKETEAETYGAMGIPIWTCDVVPELG